MNNRMLFLKKKERKKERMEGKREQERKEGTFKRRGKNS